ncbi:sensor histidine kinase [Povalibacter sp.]|uniref:sensor histidine kinase n=1 Tax=Povalibacter sp. TaxID=1962978 RepID=UPI002F3ECB49
MPKTLRNLAGIWLAWTLAGLFYLTQDFIARLYRSEPVRLTDLFVGWMAAMYICAAFTPAILWLGRRWSVERGHRLKHIALHLGGGAVFSVVSAVIEAPVLLALGVFPAPLPAMPFLSAVSLLLVYGFSGGVIRYWAVVGLQAVFRSHQRAKEREREALELKVRSSELAGQLAAAQLGALKMQLQPHFLFNTLGAIMVLMQQSKTEQAQAMLARLGDLLRLTLEDVNAQEVPLWRELEFLRLYLSIEQIRFADRLNVEITTDPDAAEAHVPHMVLQPIVENAVRHGLGQSEDAVLIEVRVIGMGSNLVMTVLDNGPGSSSSGFEGKGIGLANTRDRLRHLYGDKASLQARNRPTGGVQVTITIPLCLAPVEAMECA